MNSFTLVLLPLVLGIGIVAVILYAQRGRRGEALQAAAAGMKFTFQPELEHRDACQLSFYTI